jgi:5-formyltetrahydrofolate cyclo-ligase
VADDSMARAKQAIRERIWDLLEREHVTEPGVRGYIPAFAGAEIAASPSPGRRNGKPPG